MTDAAYTCPECDISGGLHLEGCPVAGAVIDAERIEEVAAILERRYPADPDASANTRLELRAIARSIRRKAGQHP